MTETRFTDVQLLNSLTGALEDTSQAIGKGDAEEAREGLGRVGSLLDQVESRIGSLTETRRIYKVFRVATRNLEEN